MDIYLQGPDGSEINLTSVTSTARRLIDGFPRGLLDSRQVEHAVRVDVDGNPYLYSVRYRPRIIDLRLVATGNTLGDLLAEIATILRHAVMDLAPCRLRIVEGSNEAYLDIHPEMSSIIPTATTSEVTLRCVSYGSWYTPIQTTTLPYRASGSVSRLVMRGTYGWSSLGGGTNGQVRALALAPNGVLYAGGSFTTAGGVSANYIARWDGSTWSPLGGGMDGPVSALAIAPDGTLYAGGSFTTAGGVSANYIARWDGSTWSPLGGGMDDAVTVLAIAPDGTLYAGGFFTTADGISANYIARWDGSTWSPLGGGMDATVIALAISPDGTLYAGGFFTTADGISANYIAQWDGTTWRSLGVEPNNAVYSLAIAPDGTLYAGGLFTAVGVVNADRIARWDGATWSPLGGGVDDVVSSLAIAPDGTLYAGGFFTVAGGTLPVNRVAVWNGFRWLPVDLEVPPASNVTEILWRSDGSMYIAGEFSGTAFYSAVSTITVNGTLYPQLVITAATPARVQYLENATTGQRVWLDSRLLSGETLTVDFNNATATSSFSGNVLRNVVPGSDMRLKLVRGSNIIRLFVPSGTVTAQLRWSPQYDSLAEALAS